MFFSSTLLQCLFLLCELDNGLMLGMTVAAGFVSCFGEDSVQADAPPVYLAWNEGSAGSRHGEVQDHCCRTPFSEKILN